MKKLLLLIGLVVLLSPLVHAGQYDGEWVGVDTCYSKKNDKLTLRIENNLGKLLSKNNVINKGKIFRKTKIGLNSMSYGGRIEGKFISDQEVVMTWDYYKDCSFRMTKVAEKKTFGERQADSGIADSDFCKIYPKASPCLKSNQKTTVAQSQLTKCKIVNQKVITKTACYGTFTWASGSKYVGEWEDGAYHGHGTFTYANGDKYVGNWSRNFFHGQGTYTFSDGRIKSGEWITGSLVKESGTTQVAKLEPKKTTFCEIYPKASPCLKPNETPDIANYCINVSKRQKQITSTACPFGFWSVGKSTYDKNAYNQYVELNSTTVQTLKTTTKKIEDNQTVNTTVDKKKLKEELKFWKDLYDEELITKEEYDEKRKKILDTMN